ncbi:MAG: NAD(+)/NADH kinase [Campylobacterales bacterium]|nr:NAD(+)/NADH kinase [Campylobacterales bacterium]
MQRKQVRKVGVVLRPSTPELKEDYYRLVKIFNAHDIEVNIESISGGMIGVMGMEFDLLCKTSDALVTLGGDGTLISVARRSFKYGVPILGIYAGNLGFLADINLDELDTFLEGFSAGNYRIDERAILEAKFLQNDTEITTHAFNDIVLTRHSVLNMIDIETLVEGRALNTYYGDGVIVSTPTGSTAYNLSAGGPVLFPLTDVFCLTPICPHSLTQRPVVFPGEFAIEMKTPKEKALIILDGQDKYELESGKSIYIKLAKNKVKLIHKKEFNYFDVLKDKLRWGE